MMGTNEPPYLPIGTDVSAKYRGAFCEAKVKKIAKSVKCKVYVKEIQSSLLVTDEFVTGTLMVGAVVEIRHPDTGRVMEGIINKMFDTSMYTVVFDDGDERTLRRTQLCLKGDKHFIESETLDNLPLSNPEHFGTPVMSGKGKRSRSSTGTGSQDESDESSDDELDDSKKVSSKADLVGKVMFYDAGEKKKPYLLPVLVVVPEAHPATLKSKDHLLIKSFKDNKFLSALKKELITFTREAVLKNEDKTLKVPMEKALLYIDNRELPVSWNKEELFGPDYDSDFDEEKSDEDNEPSEEEDRFVAQLYKFCDDRGTPINKAPSVGSKDLNLYKLFKVVQKLGGYNRVTNQMKWRLVYSKMLLPPSNTASTQIKNAYKKYLHAFEDFYRKLGSTMGTISRPGRSRHDSGRSILNFRGREKEAVLKEQAKAVKDLEKTSHDSGKETDKESSKETTKEGSKIEPNLEKTDKADTSLSEMETESEPATPVAPPISTPKRPKSARLKAEVRLIKDDKDAIIKEEKKEKKEVKKDDQKIVKKMEEGVTPEKTQIKQESVDGKKDKDDVKKEEGKKDKNEGKKEEGKKDKDEGKKEGKKGEGRKVDEGKNEEGKKDKAEGKKEGEKKVAEKRELKVKVMKKDVEEDKESKDGQKKLSRRRVARTDEETEGRKDKKEVSKDEVKDKKNEQKEKEQEKEVPKAVIIEEKKVIKKEVGSKVAAKKEEKMENKSDEEPVSPVPSSAGLGDLPAGAKLRVRYGRGRNQREYEAKILEVGAESSHRQYLVHYAGWNNRHDEWIKPERIVKVLDKPDQKGKVGLKPSTKILKKPVKKKLMSDKAPASPSSVASSDSGPAPTQGRGRPPKSKSPATLAVRPAAKGRPTRSNSVEQMVVTGIQPKRRPKKSADKMEKTKGSESDESEQSEEEEMSTELEKTEQVKNAMPSIDDDVVNDKSSEELEEDTNIDRSPPQLSKVTDIAKEKSEGDEKVEVKSDMKEQDEAAPVLNVVEREKSNEPILQKIEAQLMSASPPNVSNVVKMDIKDKDSKRKETVEKKSKKGFFKWEAEDAAKKAEKVMDVKVSPIVNKAEEESPYEFRDELELEPDFHRERKKPIVLMEDCRKESPRKESPRKESPRSAWQDNEGSNLLQKLDKEEVGIVPVPMVKNLTEVKDFSKSDSEVEKVERRGRKRKDVKEKELKEKEMRDSVKKGKVAQTDKTATVVETKASVSPERRAFITLAEKKQVYSLFTKRAHEIEPEKIVTPHHQISWAESEADNKEDQKKQFDNVVIHKAFDTVKTIDIDTVKSDKSENVAESGANIDLITPAIIKTDLIPLPVEEKNDSAETEKKKVRKKARKKISREEEILNLYGPKKKLGGRRRRNTDNEEKESVDNSAKVDNKADIDLSCNEKIRSRSASPESKKSNINVIQGSQGFEPLFEAVECKLKESQQNQENAMSREYKSTPFKGNLFENTPPSTPEHDSDGASQNSQEQAKINVSALDASSKLCANQHVGSESPWGIGNTSPSSGSSGVVAGSEGSIDVVVNSTKRRRESDEPTPTKRRKRISRNKSFNRAKPAESDSEDASNMSSKCRSPHYSSDSYAAKSSSQLAHRNRSPRPPKYNFNLEEGKYLEGNQRIAFLVDKVQEIRKIYMSLKAEVACIDRRRKRARRREKEKDNARNTSSGEVDYS